MQILFKKLKLHLGVSILLAAGNLNAQSLGYSFLNDELTLVIVHGQSLSIGVSDSSATVSAISEYPLNALTLDSGNSRRNSVGWQSTKVNPDMIKNFIPLIQKDNQKESPSSGILSSILRSFDENSLPKPKLLAISGGQGGRSLAELMVYSEKEFFSSLQIGLASVQEGQPFYIKNVSGQYDFYLKKNSQAVKVTTASTTLRPVYYDNILAQVKKTVLLAQSKNLKINKNLYMVWIQGQADTNNPYYKEMLNRFVQRAESDLQQATGLQNMQFKFFISQLRGSSNKDRAIDQVELANENQNVYIAAQESWISNGFALSAGLDTHLTKVGYRLLGEQIGRSIFSNMMVDQKKFPIIKTAELTADQVLVAFEGMKGSLEADNSIHEKMGFPVPKDFGFQIYNLNGSLSQNLTILSSRIEGANKVLLTLSSKPSQAFYLYLGRNETPLVVGNKNTLHSGTTLRDSVKDSFEAQSMNPLLQVVDVPFFAPIQRVKIEPSKTINNGYLGILSK